MLVFRGSATTKRAAPRQYLELTGWKSQDDCGMDQEKSRCPRDTPNSQVFGRNAGLSIERGDLANMVIESLLSDNENLVQP